MKSVISEQNFILGFLTLFETSAKDGYLGAILITDSYGIPQEFRCTHPVKPTTIQKPLYGDKLEPYIGTSLCGLPLIKSIQSKPSVIVVQKEYLLEIRKEASLPVLFIRKAGEAIDININATQAAIAKRERLDCSTGRFQPIILSTHHEFSDDIEPLKGMIEKIFAHLDLTEPFERMKKADDVLTKQDNRFQ